MWASNLALTALLVSLLGSVFAEPVDVSELKAAERDDPEGKGVEYEQYDGYISNASQGNKCYRPRKACPIKFSAVGIVRGSGRSVLLATTRPGESAYYRVKPKTYTVIVFVAHHDLIDTVPVEALISNRRLFNVNTIDTILNTYEAKCGPKSIIFTNVLADGDRPLFPVVGRDKDV